MELIRRRAAMPSGPSVPSSPSSGQTAREPIFAPVAPATRFEIVSMTPRDRLNDSLEDLWPGIAAEAAAAGPLPQPTGPWRQPAHVQEAIDAAIAKKPRARAVEDPRDPKAKIAREPRPRKSRRTRDTTPTACVEPVTAAADPVEAVTVAPAARAGLGRCRPDPTPLPSEAKRVVQGSDVPARLTGTVIVTGSFRASTGVAIVVDVEGVSNVARGLVVWAGPLQDQVRLAEGRTARIAVAQPANPRFNPTITKIAIV